VLNTPFTAVTDWFSFHTAVPPLKPRYRLSWTVTVPLIAVPAESVRKPCSGIRAGTATSAARAVTATAATDRQTSQTLTRRRRDSRMTASGFERSLSRVTRLANCK